MTALNRYDPTDPSTVHERIVFHDNRYAQASEQNEAFDVITAPIGRAMRALFAEGQVVTGAEVSINSATGDTTVGAGEIFIDGQVRPVPAGAVTIPVVGPAIVGIYLRRATITHLDDPRLKGQIDGSRAKDQPGADRVHVSCVWGLAGDGQAGNFFGVYEIEDGLLKRRAAAATPWASDIERYDVRSTGGSYRVSGLAVRQLDDDETGRQVYAIDAGSAHINGRLYEQFSRRIVRVDPRRNIDTVMAEPHPASGAATQRITVTRPPIVGIPQATIVRRHTALLTRANVVGGADLLSAGALEIESVTSGATTFTPGTDYLLNAGQVDWSPPGAEPAPGTTYTVVFKEQIAGTITGVDATGFTVAEALSGSVITARYDYALRRVDRLCLDPEGEPALVRGVPDVESPIAPAVPQGMLDLATIRQWWVSRTITATGTTMVPMQAIGGIFDWLNELRVQLATLRLSVATAGRWSGQNVGQFADPMEDNSMRDVGREQTAMIADGALRLPDRIDAITLDPGRDQHTIPYTQGVWGEQPLQTGRMTISGTVTPTARTGVELTPSVDRWLAKPVLDPLAPLPKGYAWADLRAQKDYKNISGGWSDGSMSFDDMAMQAALAMREADLKKSTIREQPIQAKIFGWRLGEQVTAVEVAGVRANITTRQPADAQGIATCTFQMPPGILAGTVQVAFIGAAGSLTTTEFTGLPTFKYNVTIMFGQAGFGGGTYREIEL